jgi:hypothetical protein
MHSPLNVKFVKVKTTLDLTIVYDLKCIKNVPLHGLKVCGRGSGGIVPFILIFGTWWKLVSFKFQPFYSRERERQAPTERGDEWAPQAVWTLWIRDSTRAHVVNRTRIFRTSSLVTTPTELSRLLLWCPPNRTRMDTDVKSLHTHVN